MTFDLGAVAVVFIRKTFLENVKWWHVTYRAWGFKSPVSI
jgi:hypothetical protein